MKNPSISLFILLIVLGCATSKRLANSLEFNTESGLNNIMRGTKEKAVLKALGSPEFVEREWEESENLKYYNYYDKGIQISVKNNEVLCVFMFYKSKRFKKYSGPNSILKQVLTIEGVKSTFGEPDYFSQSTHRELGEFPGKEQTYMSYEHIGLSFTFWNGELGDIRFIKNVKNRL